MKTKLTALVLALGAALGAFEAGAALAGNGTQADPYRIGSYGDLVAFAAKVNGGETNACAVLTADIMATSTTWTPIGDWGKAYVGTFDGQNHTISDLSNASVSPSPDFSGLFGVVESDGTVRSVKMVNATIYGCNRVGGIAGNCRNGATIVNCRMAGSVTGASSTSDSIVGGIVGACYQGVVEACESSATVTSDYYAGGIAGANYPGTVKNCSNIGEVVSTSLENSDHVGGIVGYNFFGSVENCCNTGTVKSQGTESPAYVGGVIGLNECGIVENCYNTGAVTSATAVPGSIVGMNRSYDDFNVHVKVSHSYGLDSVAGGVTVGAEEDTPEVVDARALSAAEFRVQSNFTGWDFDEVWKMGENAPLLRIGYDVITYDENWADGKITKKELDAGDGILANAPADPKREGWCFYGWLTAPEDGVKVTDETVVSGEATYYAQWGRPAATFAAGAVSSSESKTVKLTVFGGSFTGPSSVKVYLSYLTAAAADLDLANATVNGVKVKGGLKFPLTLAWDTGDVTPYVIEIPLKGDKQVEDDETLTFQLADVIGTEMGETDVCTVTVKDPAFDELRGRIETGTATKAESNNWIKVSHDGIPYFCGLADPADGGKVTGSGYCPDGKKVTLKASANKGWKFLGWTCGGRGATALPDDDDGRAGSPLPADEDGFVATTASLVIDRTAKPAANSKTSTTISNLTESTTFYAVFEGDPRVTATPVAFTEEGVVVASEGGKVTGAGRYAPGKKVTLKATAGKGFVFGGWYAANGKLRMENGKLVEVEEVLPSSTTAAAPLSQEASYSFEMGEEDVDLYARFVMSDADAGSIVATFNGAAMPSPSDGSPAITTNVWAGVYLEWPLASSALSQTTVKVAGLPAGLKFTAKDIVDSKTKLVTVPANTIYGAPTAASKTGKDGKPTPSAVKVTVTTAGKSSATYEIALTVDPLPAWAVGSFDGAVSGGRGATALPDDSDGRAGSPLPAASGTVALTIAASGKISGKILEGGRTWTLAAESFSRAEVLEPLEQLDDRLVFRATVIGKANKEVVTNEVTVVAGTRDACPYRCGVASGWQASEPAISWTAYQNLWKRADTKAAQPVFKKNIDVEYYPLGASGDKDNTVKFTFKKDGVVAFSGKVGGVSVSGSAQLVWVSGALGESALPDGGHAGRVTLPDVWYMTVYVPPKPTAKPPFAGWCETFPVKLTMDEQNIVRAVELGGEVEPEMLQLWEGGPFWATKNIGAESPEDSGYYFWWGDTIGYKWENKQWVASDGSVSGFSFEDDGSNAPTWNKDLATLQSEGWITSDGILAPEHDAAQVHRGEGWRMPTYQEVSNLVEKCDWEPAVTNGVNGWIVRGRDDFAANSIFLPCTGLGYGTSLDKSNSHGTYWSSVPIPGFLCFSGSILFYSGYHSASSYSRFIGQTIRPVQSPAE